MNGRFARLAKSIMSALRAWAVPARQPADKRTEVVAARGVADRKPPRPGQRSKLARSWDAPAPETILIPAGPYFAGLTDAQARQFERRPDWSDVGSEVNLPAFRIAKFPVTNGEFMSFLANTGRPPPIRWDGPEPPEPLRDHPVVWVGWATARAYCDWLRAATGVGYRLPTAEEWEKAARGPDGRMFPWGDEFDPSRCRFRSRSTTPVTAHVPAGDSPYGVSDMAGNAREWTSTVRLDVNPIVVVRGGGFLAGSEPELWCAFKDLITGRAKASIGFRLAISVSEPGSPTYGP